MKKNEKEATNIKTFFKENSKSIINYLIELYEFQENIKINYSVEKKEA